MNDVQAMTETAQHLANVPADTNVVTALGERVIVIVGMMGAGKTTVGRRLAARLRLPFVDADQEIELAAGMSIADIFAIHGEAYFRDGEARVIARLLDGGPSVLATGGGAFLRDDTRQRIATHGISLWLNADADIVLKRIRRRADRPLLQTPDPAATIERLIAERTPFYRMADIAIPSRDVPHDKVVDECADALRAYLCGTA